MRNITNHITHAIRKRNLKLEVRLLLLITLLSILSPIITNNKPLFCTVDGTNYYPAFSDLISPNHTSNITGQILTGSSKWEELEYEKVVWPLFQNGPLKLDIANKNFQSPFARSKDDNGVVVGVREQHLFGTDRHGKDIFSNLLSGIKYSLLISISAIVLAAAIGIFLGAISGFYQNDYAIGRSQLIAIIISLLPAWFYGFSVRSFAIVDGFEEGVSIGLLQLLFSFFLFMIICIVASLTGRTLDKWLNTKPYVLHLDNLITGFTEIFSSVPGIIIIVTLAAITGEKSTIVLILILGFTSWPSFARITRAEVMRIREKPYVESAKALGITNSRIVRKHILKNALPTLAVAVAFGIGGLILVESALSFLNIGVPDNTPTLGSVLRAGREHIEAWWLIIFPGATIFLLIYLFNRIGDKISTQSNRNKG